MEKTLKPLKRICLFFACLMPLAGQTAQAAPPFSGTIFIDPDIITPADPTTFQSLSYLGQDTRTMFDRRVADWTSVNAFLFDARFDDGLSAEIQVNPEFGTAAAAMAEAEKYGWVIGQLPTALRADVQTVWIHQGNNPFGGGNNNLLIHTGQADSYLASGILEETLVHEAVHTSLDATHAAAAGWLAAQEADSEFISTYARDFPNREDIAETFLLYLAVRYRSDRISQSLLNTIVQTIPHRIAYFDSHSFDIYPILAPSTSIGAALTANLPQGFELQQNYPNPFNPETKIGFQITQPTRVVLSIFNLLGQDLLTLVDAEKTAGFYTVVWNGRDRFGRRSASGVYLYRIEAQGLAVSRKMVLLP